jgi:hypothetical protein
LFGRGFGGGGGGGRGVAEVLLEEVLDVLVEAYFEQGFFQQGAFNGLVVLVVEVLADDVCEFGGGVGVDVFLLLVHLNNQLRLS